MESHFGLRHADRVSRVDADGLQEPDLAAIMPQPETARTSSQNVQKLIASARAAIAAQGLPPTTEASSNPFDNQYDETERSGTMNMPLDPTE